MGVRGQSKEAWFKRWRTGTCPVHGLGFTEDKDEAALQAASAEGFVAERCPNAECTVRVATWDLEDARFKAFGWRAGPEEIRAVLVKAKDIDSASTEPGAQGRPVRVWYPTSDDL